MEIIIKKTNEVVKQPHFEIIMKNGSPIFRVKESRVSYTASGSRKYNLYNRDYNISEVIIDGVEYNTSGFSSNGIHYKTKTNYDDLGFSIQGLHKDTKTLRNKEGLNKFGRNKGFYLSSMKEFTGSGRDIQEKIKLLNKYYQVNGRYIDKDEYQNMLFSLEQEKIKQEFDTLLNINEYEKIDNLLSDSKDLLGEEDIDLLRKRILKHKLLLHIKQYEFNKADLLVNEHKGILSHVKYVSMKARQYIQYITVSLKQFNFVEADRKFTEQGITCVSKKDYNTLRQQYYKLYIENEIENLLQNMQYNEIENLILENQVILGKDYIDTKKKEILSKQVKQYLQQHDFIKADMLFSSHEEILIHEDYRKIKALEYIEYIRRSLEQGNFIESDEKFNNQGIECISQEDYDEIKVPYIKKVIQNAFTTQNYEIVNKLLSENKKILGNMYVKNIKRELFEKELQDYIERGEFLKADTLFSKHDDLLSDKQYISIKIKPYTQYIKQSLEQFNFIEADKRFNNQGVVCISQTEYMQIKLPYIKEYFNNNDKINDEKYEILADTSKNLLIKARAGTGKSTGLEYKIAFLKNAYKIDPLEMFIFAFNKVTAQKMNEDLQNGLNNEDSLSLPHFDGAMTFHSFAGKVLGLGREGWRTRVVVDRQQDKTMHPEHIIGVIIAQVFSDNQALKELLYEYFKKEVDELENTNRGLSQESYYYAIRNTKYEGSFSQETLNGEVVKSVGEKWIADFLFEHNIEYKYEASIYKNQNNGLNETYQPDFLLTEFTTKKQNLDGFRKESIPGEHAFDVLYLTDNRTGLKTRIDPEKNVERRKVIIEHWGIQVGNPNQKMPTWRTGTRKEYRDEITWKRKFLTSNKYSLIETSIEKIDYTQESARTQFEDYLRTQLEKIGIVCIKEKQQNLIEKAYKKQKGALIETVSMYITKAKQLGWTPEILKAKSNFSASPKTKIFYQLANLIYAKYQAHLKDKQLLDMEDVLQQAGDTLLKKESRPIKRQDDTDKTCSIKIQNIKYIMVDEYQDCNRLFFRLLKGILGYNENIRIICVGDDWQLINSFAGSDIQYFRDFQHQDKFGEKNSTILSLRETFRCPNPICTLANAFYGEEGGSYSNIQNYELMGFSLDSSKYCYIENVEGRENYENDTRFFPKRKKYQRNIKGEIVRDSNGEKIPEKDTDGKYIYEYQRVAYNMTYARYLKHLFEICRENWGLKKIFILSRNKKIFQFEDSSVKKHLYGLLKEAYYKEGNKSIKREDFDQKIEEKIVFNTMHRSKGQEADLVILLEIGTNKFPRLHPNNELNAIFGETIADVLAEERRLFYVALTRTKNKLYYISEKEIGNTSPGEFLINSWGNN